MEQIRTENEEIKMKALLWIAALFLSAYSREGYVNNFWVINETKGCDYSIQVNEGDKVLINIEGHVYGEVGSFSIFGSGYQNVCLITKCSGLASSSCETMGILEEADWVLGRQSFKNSKGENCFFSNSRFVTDSDGGFFTYYKWFSHVSLGISCEPPANIPDYCGKSEAYATRVLLENHRARCDSRWREEFIDNCKEDVC
jgi:hypothetical protein